jgi:hypothetical protein
MTGAWGLPTPPAIFGIGDAIQRGTLRQQVNRSRFLPFEPTLLDSELLAVVDTAAAIGRPLAVLLPFPAPAAATLLGTAILVAAIQQSRMLDVEVAVVSPRIAARLAYEEFAFEEHKLCDFVPRTRVSPDGSFREVGNPKRATTGRLHFATDLGRLARISSRLRGVVIDSQAAEADALRRELRGSGGRPFVYMASNPFDPGIPAVRDMGGLVWCWDQETLSQLAASARVPRGGNAGPLLASPASIAAYAEARVAIVKTSQADSQRLDEALGQGWAALKALAPHTRSGGFDDGATVKWAYSAYNVLAACPVAPSKRDRFVGMNPYAMRVGDAPSVARVYAKQSSGNAKEAWYKLADAFDRILSAEEDGARFRELERWANEQAAEGQASMVVVGGRVDKLALAAALDESPTAHPDWRSATGIASRREVRSASAGPLGDTVLCIPGPLTRRDAGWLAVPPGKGLVVLVGGDFEAGRASRQATHAAYAVRHIRDVALEQEGIGSCACPSLAPRAPRDNEDLPIVTTRHGDPTPRRMPEPGGVWEPFDADMVKLLSRTSRGDIPELPRGSSLSVGLVSRALAIYLANGGVLLAQPNDLVVRYRKNGMDRVVAKAVAVGDVVFLVEQGVRRDLFSTVLDRLSETVEYGVYVGLIDFWHTRAGRHHGSDLSYEEIHRRMLAYGTKVTTTQTIGNWVRGVVAGPQDPEDIRRFARAVRDGDLQSSADAVAKALAALNSLHRRAGHWLNAQIDASRATEREDRGDELLGIRVSDLMEAVRPHRVLKVDLTPHWTEQALIGLVATREQAVRARSRPQPS